MKRRMSFLILAGMLLGATPLFAAAASPEFKNGPYLLAPKTESMVVAWESTTDADATIAFGADENALAEPIPVAVSADAPDFQGKKMNLFHYKLKDLKPGTRYFYEVSLPGGETRKASFKTLSQNPEKVNLITLSDSHVFSTRPKFDAAVKQFDPDLILHCGDLVEGTGVQTEQFAFWFKGANPDDYIHFYPVVYASGNHDQGGEYFNAYVYNIQDAEYGGSVTGNSSFNYGNLHIMTINSNPWGLFQLNSEAAGNRADAATLESIEKTLAWIKSDLESDAAKRAEFRLAVFHHPKSDAYTNRYLPAVLEPGNVDVTLSGHTHSYARAVSDNPETGAGTVYMTHQDSRIHNRRGDFFHITSVPGEGTLKIEAYGATGPDADTKLAATTVISHEKQQLAFSDISIAPNEVPYNGDVEISATVTNTGKGLAAAAIPVRDNDAVRYLYKFGNAIKLLEPGESVSLSAPLKMESLGVHKIALADKTASVDVKFRPATFDYSNVRIKMGDGEISDLASNKLNLKADITNIGNEAGVEKAELKVDGKVVADASYRLASGETKTTEFHHVFPAAGEYAVSIGNAPARTVFVEGSIRGMPIVGDKSGNGNYAVIHGQPTLGKDDRGRQTLILDGRRDYLEVPDNGGYTIEDAVSGMVWANLPGAGTTKGGLTELVEPYVDLDGKGSVPDHNPLMIKGISIGWGTPYLFRIAVRETGKMTYGVCLDDADGEFQWGDGVQPEAGIKKDTWVQYTGTFDFIDGGDGYQNGYHSAHVGKPVFDAPIKNWAGAPLRVGLSFKNTLLPGRGRGIYHTMLPGAVSQVRFYAAKVSAEENDRVRENPEAAGMLAKDLKIWLDFENENIETKGTHTTEWVAIDSAPRQLAYDASFSGAASITATIQTSDDQENIKDESSFALASGKGSAEWRGMGKAKYARIRTVFVSDLNQSESSVPVLREYVLTDGDGKAKRWNALADWKQGDFEGAVGYQLEDVYRNHARDFDDYSGAVDEPDA